MPWERQPITVTVLCPNREITQWVQLEPERIPQRGAAIYATFDRARCWLETYLIDGPDRLPSWRCNAVFHVRAA